MGVSNAQTCELYIGGYIPYYRSSASVDYTKLSHVFYAFASTSPEGILTVSNEAEFETFKTASIGKQRFLSLGGGGDNSFGPMASSSQSISTLAQNCVAFCKANDLEGIDVDWEGITTPADSVKFGNFVRELGAQLHGKDLKLVITIGFGSWSGDHYNLGAIKNADWIQLMVYDQTGTWGDSPYGNHASYQHMLDAIDYWTNRGYTDLSKMVIGMPFYGYRFNSDSGGNATAVTYEQIVTDNPNLNCDIDEVGLTVFNGPTTIREKVLYVKEHGLKGVMIWELGQDISSTEEKSLLNAVSKAACGEGPSCVDDVISAVSKTTEEKIIVTNPIQNALRITAQNSNDKIYKVELIDNLGRVTATKQNQSAENNDELNVSTQAPGIYFLRVTLQHETILKRVIKI